MKLKEESWVLGGIIGILGGAIIAPVLFFDTYQAILVLLYVCSIAISIGLTGYLLTKFEKNLFFHGFWMSAGIVIVLGFFESLFVCGFATCFYHLSLAELAPLVFFVGFLGGVTGYLSETVNVHRYMKIVQTIAPAIIAFYLITILGFSGTLLEINPEFLVAFSILFLLLFLAVMNLHKISSEP